MIGIVLPIHNGAPWLRLQLESIAAQTERPSRVVFVDDCSNDTGPAIALEWLGQQSIEGELVKLRQPRPPDLYSRVASAVQRGLRSLGPVEFVAFCDQDDVWHPGHLERLMLALDENPRRGFAFSNATFIDEDGHALPGNMFDRHRVASCFNVLASDRQFAHLLRKPRVTGTTMLARRQAIQWVGDPPATVLHDRWFSLALAAVGQGGVALHESLTSYRLHGKQVVGVSGDRRLRARLKRGMRRIHQVDRQLAEIEGLRKILDQCNAHVRRSTHLYAQELRLRSRISKGLLSPSIQD